MKLRIIAEVHDRERADATSLEQSLLNVRYIALNKLRKMLAAMGLVQGDPNIKHTVKKPMPDVISVFDKLRHIVKHKIDNQIKTIQREGLQSQSVQYMQNFWGYQFPTGWTDFDVGQYGTPNVEGTYDDLLRQTVKQSQGLPQEGKIEVLKDLATQLQKI